MLIRPCPLSCGRKSLSSAPEPGPFLSQEFRRRAEAARQDALGQAIGAVVVERMETLMAATFAQGLVEPVAGRVGHQDLLRPSNPAPGADFVQRVGGEAVLWPLSVMATLTTSAAVGERSLTVEYRDADGVRYLVAGSQATLAASQVQSFCWQPEAGGERWPVDDVAIAPLPQQMLYPLSQLAVSIGNADAGDQLSALRLSVQLYPTG